MGAKSWTLTIVPLILAIAATLKAVFFGSDLTEQEAEMLKFIIQIFMTWFIGSGAIGGGISIASKLKTNS